MDCYVYALVDPRNQRVRYIGCTITPASRLADHMYSSNHLGKKEWVDELKACGLKPIMKIMKTCATGSEAEQEEKRLYNLYNDGEMLCGDPNTFRYAFKVPDGEVVNIRVKLPESIINKLNEISRHQQRTPTMALSFLINEEYERRHKTAKPKPKK